MNRATSVLVLLISSLTGCAGGPATGAGAVAEGSRHDPPALAVEGFRVVDEGVAIAGQPSDDALRDAAAREYRTVVNLRTDGESPDPSAEGALVTSIGMRYVRIPVVRGSLLPEQADRLAEVLASPDAKPLLLHCGSGARAAALWDLHLARTGR